MILRVPEVGSTFTSSGKVVPKTGEGFVSFRRGSVPEYQDPSSERSRDVVRPYLPDSFRLTPETRRNTSS